MRLWSRNGNDFTAKFPDVQAALAAQVDVDCVLDGELVVWTGERLDFDALQQRMANTATTVRRRLAPAQPASFVAFDILAVDSVDVRPMRWIARRTRLEALAAGWTPPLQLSPVTADVDEAKEWLEAFKASGVEGLVVKGASSRYLPGRREWLKVNSAGWVVPGWLAGGVLWLVSGWWPCATGVADVWWRDGGSAGGVGWAGGLRAGSGGGSVAWGEGGHQR